MASADGSSDGAIIAGINVTPLVDITLVLLLVFMVTAKAMVAPAVPLDLPRAAKTEDVQTMLSVMIPAQGPILVNGVTATNQQDLLSRVRAATAAGAAAADLRVVIQADGAVAHRRVIQVLDVLRQAGIAHIAFAALPPE